MPMWMRSSGLITRPVVQRGVHALLPFVLEQDEQKPILVNGSVQKPSIGMGKKDVQMVHVYDLAVV